MQELGSSITDEWFRSHFNYAADIVIEWLQPEVDLRRSRIVDFGCGDGIMDLGVALKSRARSVTGIDIHDASSHLAATAKVQLGLMDLPANLHFLTVAPGTPLSARTGNVDCIFSWSVFEHIQRDLLKQILADIYDALPRGGVFFLQIEPLYYSPYGSHLSGIIKTPWAHLLMSEEELVAEIDAKTVDQMAEDQKNKTFEICSFNDFKNYLKREYRSLNKLTSDELLRYVEEAGFVVKKRKLNMVAETPPEKLLANHSVQDLRCAEILLLLVK